MQMKWRIITGFVLVLAAFSGTDAAKAQQVPIFGDPIPNMDELTKDQHSYFLDEADMYNTYKSRNRGLFGERANGLSTTNPNRGTMFNGNGVMRSGNGSFIGINRTAPNSMFKPYHPPEALLQAEALPAQIVVPKARVGETPGFAPNQLPPPVVASGEAPSVVSGRVIPPEQAAGWIRPIDERPSVGGAESGWMRDLDGRNESSPADAASREAEYRDWATARTTPQSLRENQVIAGRVARMIVQTPGVGATAPITVAVVNGGAVLRGEVATDYGRRLAEQIARNDPDIGVVSNQLTVKSQGRVVSPQNMPAGQFPPQSQLPANDRLPVAEPLTPDLVP